MIAPGWNVLYGGDVKASVTQTPDAVHVNSIFTAPEARRRGLAGQAMQEIISYAQGQGLPVILTPEPLKDKPVSEKQLRGWYKRLGFRPQRGKKYMIKRP